MQFVMAHPFLTTLIILGVLDLVYRVRVAKGTDK